MTADWVGDEEAAAGVRAELGRLGRRARRRPGRTLAWALVCSALAVGVVLARPPVYVSRVAFGVSGGGAEPLRAGQALRDWVAGTVLSDERLRALIDTVGLYPGQDPRRAVEEMRDDLDIHLARAGRSAMRLGLTLHGRDGAKVYAATVALGQLVADGRAHDHPPRRALGLRVEPLVAAHLDAPRVGRVTFVALVGVLAFLLALPLAAVGVGAFDPLVYELEDVSRLGMPVMGAIRRFDGDNAGALVARLGHGRIGPS